MFFMRNTGVAAERGCGGAAVRGQQPGGCFLGHGQLQEPLRPHFQQGTRRGDYMCIDTAIGLEVCLHPCLQSLSN